VRATVAVLVAAMGAVLAALIMAEYEFEGFTPWLAAAGVGVLAGEIVGGLGRWRGTAAMIVTGAIAAGAILYGEWLESDSGLEPWSQLAWGAAALAAAIAAWSVRPRTAPTA
jgi:hypothetical protein